ncbi:MAG: prepilin-type N-terminal cleavage/methylation domain-containing protein [Desulfobulbaceae bacterium]|nr:prepilin-type N-terminal cleavage/methylation domain-containing protein [Desulfobulbaceae bacterium]
MNKQRGFTLIEVLIAITVFSVGILAVIMMQGTSVDSNAKALQITEAVTVSGREVEEILAEPYDTLVDGNKTFGNYTLSWVVINDNPIKNVKMVTVTSQRTGLFKNFRTKTVMVYFKQREF